MGRVLLVAVTVPFVVEVYFECVVEELGETYTALVVGIDVEVGVAVEVMDTATEGGAEEAARVAVPVSDTREPVKLYAAAQATRSIPSGQHQVFPDESEVQ